MLVLALRAVVVAGDLDGVVHHAERGVEDAVLLEELLRAGGHGCSLLVRGCLEGLELCILVWEAATFFVWKVP